MKPLKTLLLLLLFCALPFAASAQEPLDYADEANWAYYAEGADKPVDVFLICPLVDKGLEGNCNMSVQDETMRARFVGALNMERGLYEAEATLYAPYYQQVTFSASELPAEESEPYYAIAYADVREAFLYFLGQTDPDRPLVLAGFSQGSDMAIRLMKEFFADEALQSRLVAAYCVGWRLTEAEVETYPWLRPAQGERDTGVIVSFNSEAEFITESFVVPEGVKTIGINPLNWRTDSTPADASLNLGACFLDKSGAITREAAALTGAYLDEARGTLKLPDIDSAEYTGSMFPDGVYHLYDYQFFYRNLQANVSARVEAYLAPANG